MIIKIAEGEGIHTVQELIQEFNEEHQLDLKVVKIEALDVNFVTVSSEKMTPNHVFKLGMKYEFKLAKLRNEGKIF